jgi:2-oxo-4-hydroxy-4-carboxy--5-ureidoimidazoline (OHCU) decarboxylase
MLGIGILTMCWLPYCVCVRVCSQETIIDGLLMSLKKGDSEEIALACRTIGLLAISLGVYDVVSFSSVLALVDFLFSL